MAFMSMIVAPGFFTSAPVQTALMVGGTAAVVSGVVGVFTVLRGQSFAGHALADISSAGGAASFLAGVNPLVGFLVVGVVAAAGIEAAHAGGVRERDVVTGVAMGAGLGLTALLLYLGVTLNSSGGAAVTVMFGSMFTIQGPVVTLALAVGAGALAAVALLYRPLLLCSVDPDLAAVRGVPVRLVGLLHLVVLALAVALSAITVGAILSTALLIGPSATALRLAARPGRAMLLAALIGVGTTWVGILVAYDSYDWTGGHGWPVSFCIVVLVFLAYVASGRFARPGS